MPFVFMGAEFVVNSRRPLKTVIPACPQFYQFCFNCRPPHRSFDYAALLRADGRPVAAAVVDVYGPDVAELFVVATRPAARRQVCIWVRGWVGLIGATALPGCFYGALGTPWRRAGQEGNDEMG
jgi:hypothetical protein